MAKKGKPAADFVMKSRVKEALKAKGCNSSSDVIEGLNMVVAWYVQQAAARAKANRRVTVRAHDFILG